VSPGPSGIFTATIRLPSPAGSNHSQHHHTGRSQLAVLKRMGSLCWVAAVQCRLDGSCGPRSYTLNTGSPGGKVLREVLRPRRPMPDDADARSSSTEIPDARLRLRTHRDECRGQRVSHANQRSRWLAVEQSPVKATSWTNGRKGGCTALSSATLDINPKSTLGHCSSQTAAPRGSDPCGAGAAQSSARPAPRQPVRQRAPDVELSAYNTCLSGHLSHPQHSTRQAAGWPYATEPP
jgi:hypothetical protein